MAMRAHLLYSGDIINAVMAVNSPAPKSFDLVLSTLDDLKYRPDDGKSISINQFPELRFINRYWFISQTDGMNLNLGGCLASMPLFVKSDLSGLEQMADELFKPFRERGWYFDVKKEPFNWWGYRAEAKTLESENKGRNWNTWNELQRKLKQLKELSKKGMYFLRVMLNSNPQGQYIDVDPSNSSRRLSRPVKDKYHLLDEIYDFGQAFLAAYELIAKTRQFEPSSDFMLHKAYDPNFHLKPPFYEWNNGKRSELLFDIDPKEQDQRIDEGFIVYNSIAEYQRAQLEPKYKEWLLNRAKRAMLERRSALASVPVMSVAVVPDKNVQSSQVIKSASQPEQLPQQLSIPQPKLVVSSDVAAAEQLQVEPQEQLALKQSPDFVPIHIKIGRTKADIAEALRGYVISQHAAIDAIAAAAYKHYVRVLSKENPGMYPSDVVIEKGNVLLYGPTGVGKTHIVRSLANLLDVPFCVADASMITTPGYHGQDPDVMISHLLSAAGGDVAKAQKGIVYIDEIDKLSNLGCNGNVGTVNVQQNLLRMVEGAQMEVSFSVAGIVKRAVVDTSDILFISGGAFSGNPVSGYPSLYELIQKRKYEHSLSRKIVSVDVGDGKKEMREVDYEALGSQIDIRDLEQYGIISELIGRFPVRVGLNKLSLHDLRRIMTEPKNAILKQAVSLLAHDSIELRFEDGAIDYIAELAYHDNLGARAISSYVERITNRLLDEVGKDKHEISVSKDFVHMTLRREW